MSVKLCIKAVLGAVALSVGGVALANTNAAGGTTGTLFLNVVDTTTGNSFFYDTGLTQATFTGTSNFNASLSSDANYQTFLAQVGAGDNVDYSLASDTKPASTQAIVQFTSVDTPAAVTQFNVGQAASVVEAFLPPVNSNTSTTTNSSYIIGQGGQNAAYWGANNEPSYIAKLGLDGDNAAIGTALAFYEEAGANTRVATVAGTTLTAYAGTWDLTADGTLSYTVAGVTPPVPIPAPVLLLLSGLGLMGVIARRGKTVATDVSFNGAAA